MEAPPTPKPKLPLPSPPRPPPPPPPPLPAPHGRVAEPLLSGSCHRGLPGRDPPLHQGPLHRGDGKLSTKGAWHTGGVQLPRATDQVEREQHQR
eukprot:scaffold246_cov97-Isochrysis_galbana.AAC.7